MNIIYKSVVYENDLRTLLLLLLYQFQKRMTTDHFHFTHNYRYKKNLIIDQNLSKTRTIHNSFFLFNLRHWTVRSHAELNDNGRGHTWSKLVVVITWT